MDTLNISLGVVVTLVIVALLFDFMNGFHDAANSIATVVSTRVLSPRAAVLWAATFNFVALFIFHQGVADTIAKTIHIEGTSHAYVWVVVCGLAGAIVWSGDLSIDSGGSSTVFAVSVGAIQSVVLSRVDGSSRALSAAAGTASVITTTSAVTAAGAEPCTVPAP